MYWKCSKPNDCTENCKLSSPIEPTGCVYEDEEDIDRDANIWEEVESPISKGM